jgi:MFS family permease
MILPPEISKHNFFAFLWHASFLAFAQNFMDADTIIPSMVIDSGGRAMHIGIMTAIMMGGSSFTQLIFAPYISNKTYKKRFLLLGINLRIVSLFALGIILFYFHGRQSTFMLWIIFVFITIFSLAGAFTIISYTDILGKSVNEEKRKTFFSSKQIIAGGVVIFSAFLVKKILSGSDYPANYAYLFFIGASLLLIASLGFWNIKESVPSMLKINGFKEYYKTLRSELKNNKKLIYFLGFINTQGIIVSFLPFVMLYAKELFNAQNNDTGNFLLFKVAGIIIVSLLVFINAKRIKYNPLLYLNAALSVLLILTTIFIRNDMMLRFIFVFGGISFSLYSITMNGLLLEVSEKENRALYTGFAGAGNILPAVFPLSSGLIISRFGFRPFFLIFMVIILLSLYFIRKIDCKK